MKKIGLMIAVFIIVHLAIAWIFWTGGYDFDKRGTSLALFSYLGLAFGSLAALWVYLFYEEKK